MASICAACFFRCILSADVRVSPEKVTSLVAAKSVQRKCTTIQIHAVRRTTCINYKIICALVTCIRLIYDLCCCATIINLKNATLINSCVFYPYYNYTKEGHTTASATASRHQSHSHSTRGCGTKVTSGH